MCQTGWMGQKRWCKGITPKVHPLGFMRQAGSWRGTQELIHDTKQEIWRCVTMRWMCPIGPGPVGRTHVEKAHHVVQVPRKFWCGQAK